MKKPTKLTLGQAYILMCAAQPRPSSGGSSAGYVNMFDDAPSGVTVLVDGAVAHVRDVTRASKIEARGLERRGLMSCGRFSSVFQITDAGRRALEERQDLVRELLRLTEERRKWEHENWGDG